MRIAILTLPLHTNYGGILQAYALQTVLERMGHEVTVITRDKRVPITTRLLFLSIPKRILSGFCGKKVDVFREFKWNSIYKKISENIAPFIDKYIKQDNRFLEKIKPTDYDVIVVGSDQIWRPKYIHNTLRSSVENAYLDFAKSWNIGRIAYAASFGTDDWEYSTEETDLIKPLLRKFNSVSVRELSGITLCRKFFDTAAEIVLDPTLLLSQCDYLSLCSLPIDENDKGILFNYVLDDSHDIDDFISEVAVEKGLVPKRVGAKIDDWSAPIEDRIQPSVEKWLMGFKEASLVITDSFHACVFSILFHKPFIAIGNVSRGLSRFDSLFEQFELQDHLLTDLSMYSPAKSYSIPDAVYKKLESLRAYSMTFLCDSISKCCKK